MTIASLLPEHDRTYPLTSRSSLTLTMESLATHQYLQQWSRWLQSASAPPWLFCAFSGSTAISEGDRRSATRRLVLGSLHLQAKRVQGVSKDGLPGEGRLGKTDRIGDAELVDLVAVLLPDRRQHLLRVERALLV